MSFRISSIGEALFKTRSGSLFLMLLLLAAPAVSQVFTNNLEDSIQSAIWLNNHPVTSGNAHSGNHYSIADSARPFGLGIETVFPESLKNSNAYVKAEGWIKSTSPGDTAFFVFTLLEGGRQVLWQHRDLKPLITAPDTWYYFVDSVKVPASVTGNGKLKAYLWNADRKDTIAIDDLKITFSLANTPSFIPWIDIVEKAVSLQDGRLLFSNHFYKVYYFASDDLIRIYSYNDSILVSDISYYVNRQVRSTGYAEKLKFKLKSVKNESKGKVIKLKIANRFARVILEMECDDHSPEIKFAISEKYKKKQVVQRESVVLASGQPVTEVYRDNRKADDSLFQNEYWLDKQGVKFGQGDAAFVIYHTPDVSSLQLKPAQRLLWVNLDFEKDHPFYHYPLRKDTTDYKLDWSVSQYKRGDRRTFSFSVYAGSNVSTLPRLMKNPNGLLATYIWSEHADFTNIRSNRAVYFGSELITRAEDAVGGFVKYNIPVTKSVFYHNPDAVTNTHASDGLFTGLVSSVKSDTAFSEFLGIIHQQGIEICLHTPEEYTTKQSWLAEALRYMHQRFQSPTWIDHGYNNGLHNNRENLVCDGTLSGSPYYALGLWKQYGIEYLNNAYYEEMDGFEAWQFEGSIEKPYSGYGEMIPDPDYFRHPGRTGTLVHWPTKSAFFIESERIWDYYFSVDRLSDFVDRWAVEFNHCYPAWVYPYRGFWKYDADSTMVAQAGFNRALEHMAALRDENRLNVCTVAQFLNYRIQQERLAYQVMPDGRIKVTNKGNSPIKGLSFAVSAPAILVNGLKPEQKEANGNLVFWFDLLPGESKLIRIIK